MTFELHASVIDAPDYRDRLDAIAEGGVNRWVFGVQSMEDRILKLNRGHTAADVDKLLSIPADRGIDNLSVDLIFGHDSARTGRSAASAGPLPLGRFRSAAVARGRRPRRAVTRRSAPSLSAGAGGAPRRARAAAGPCAGRTGRRRDWW
ncbi:radical SAM protein [Streptomyces cinereospinus]|uniref:Radical SAM protein n=1 Tax=Streptomyces cinereospinus TaxID=285561 RepID=A0ABV5N742_9ACTN